MAIPFFEFFIFHIFPFFCPPLCAVRFLYTENGCRFSDSRCISYDHTSCGYIRFSAIWLYSEMFSCCEKASQKTDSNTKSKSHRNQTLINLPDWNEIHDSCQYIEFCQNKTLQRNYTGKTGRSAVIAAPITPRIIPSRRNGSRTKAICSSYVFHNSDFFFTER